jgi:hypothetical protein
MTRLLLLSVSMMLAQAQTASVEEIRKIPGLEKRFEAGLAFGEEAMRQARRVVSEAGTVAELKTALAGVAAGVELSLEALRATGKSPRKLGRQYKKGEVKSRDVLRQLEQLVPAISLESRQPAEEARDRVARTHEAFLEGVMSKK